MIKLKDILKFTRKHEGNIVSEGYWDTVNSLCIFKKLKLVLENCKVSLSAPKNSERQDNQVNQENYRQAKCK